MMKSENKPTKDQRCSKCAPSEEPGAVVPHAGICEGGTEQSVSLPQSAEMKTHLALFALFVMTTIVTVHGEPKKEELKAPDFTELAAEFYSNVSAPGHLALSIKDQATLEIAKDKLQKRQKRITQLAEEFQKLPVPDAATKRAVNKSMEEKEEQMKKEIGEALKKHFKEMPAELAKQWAPALRAFYQNLDQNKEVFSRYFGESVIKKKS